MANLRKLVGIKISEYRKIKGITQAGLAEKTGLSNDFISRVERGERSPSIKTLDNITNALDVSLGEFFDFGKIQRNEKISVESERIRTYLKNKDEKDIRLAYDVIKAIFEKLENSLQ